MVNIFIIHSGKDYEYVKNVVEPYLMGKTDENGEKLEGMPNNANILTLESGKPSQWKSNAKKQIRMAQVVIVVIGEDASNPGKEKSMGWEAEVANKYNKQIMILNLNDYPIPKYLYQPDRFTKQEKVIAKQQTLSEIKERIDRFAAGYYDIFSSKFEEMDPSEQAKHKNELLDQYKMFQKTSEDLISRRQSVNSFYISVNSALVGLLGVIMGLVEAPVKFYVVFFMCIVGLILDISWSSILEAYGTLNAAKMKVINLIEEQLPVALYDVEWRIMSDKLNNKKYVSFTDSEKRIPKIFALVYGVIMVGIAVIVLLSL